MSLDTSLAKRTTGDKIGNRTYCHQFWPDLRKNVNKLQREIKRLANRYNLQLIYAFGSRAKEVFGLTHGKKAALPTSSSDLDIGLKSRRFLSVEEKVKIAVFFEDLFGVPRVDVAMLPEAPVMLALEIVQGELLFAEDDRYEAEYQLYIMRMAAELAPFERMKKDLILEMPK
jgi:predicted nucleotidyltransferase